MINSFCFNVIHRYNVYNAFLNLKQGHLDAKMWKIYQEEDRKKHSLPSQSKSMGKDRINSFIDQLSENPRVYCLGTVSGKTFVTAGGLNKVLVCTNLTQVIIRINKNKLSW